MGVLPDQFLMVTVSHTADDNNCAIIVKLDAAVEKRPDILYVADLYFGAMITAVVCVLAPETREVRPETPIFPETTVTVGAPETRIGPITAPEPCTKNIPDANQRPDATVAVTDALC